MIGLWLRETNHGLFYDRGSAQPPWKIELHYPWRQGFYRFKSLSVSDFYWPSKINNIRLSYFKKDFPYLFLISPWDANHPSAESFLVFFLSSDSVISYFFFYHKKTFLAPFYSINLRFYIIFTNRLVNGKTHNSFFDNVIMTQGTCGKLLSRLKKKKESTTFFSVWKHKWIDSDFEMLSPCNLLFFKKRESPRVYYGWRHVPIILYTLPFITREMLKTCRREYLILQIFFQGSTPYWHLLIVKANKPSCLFCALFLSCLLWHGDLASSSNLVLLIKLIS